MKSNFIDGLNELYLFQFFFIKVLVATICGVMIGWDRERKHKAAGIRTNVLVAVGTCLLTATSFFISDFYNVDPTRIIGQIVTGIGFIGGAVVFKQGDRITGVTTATFIWVMCGLGVLAGMGLIILPIVLTLGLLIMTMFLQKLEDRIHKDHEE